MKVGICSPTSALRRATTMLLPVEREAWIESRWEPFTKVDGFLVGEAEGNLNIIVPVATISGEPLKRFLHIQSAQEHKSVPVHSFEELGIVPVLNYGVFVAPEDSILFAREIGADETRQIPHTGSAFLRALEEALDNEAFSRLKEAAESHDMEAAILAIEWRQDWATKIALIEEWLASTIQ